jgi:hypothetical protein
MRHITAAEVRQFLVERYTPALSSAGVSLDSIPAKPIANVGLPLTEEISLKEFSEHLKLIQSNVSDA